MAFTNILALTSKKIVILYNSLSPFFYEMFPQDQILPHKSQPPILAYTSTPFRGLDLLLDIFPKIRSAVPGTRLKIFSSMKTYLVDEGFDRSKYGFALSKCQETEGVEYVGSIPKPQLAEELKSVAVLAYPNTFSETFCTAVIEAMASGCWIVTSELGALPETTAGFARLIPMAQNWETYIDNFIQQTVNVLQTSTTVAETHLRKQVDFVNQNYNWDVRAQQWIEFLDNFTPTTSNSQVSQSQLIFNLKAINLIIFPDWNQSEESLNLELSKVIHFILIHPDNSKITLIIEASQIAEEDANLILSSVVMNLIMTEDLDIEEEPEICIVRNLNLQEWSFLLPRIQYRIVLENEQKDLAKKAVFLPAIKINN